MSVKKIQYIINGFDKHCGQRIANGQGDEWDFLCNFVDMKEQS